MLNKLTKLDHKDDFFFKARHIYICDHHKNFIQSFRAKRKRKDSEDDSAETDSEYPGQNLT